MHMLSLRPSSSGKGGKGLSEVPGSSLNGDKDIYISICYISHMSLQKSAVKKIGNMVTIIQHPNNADSTL